MEIKKDGLIYRVVDYQGWKSENSHHGFILAIREKAYGKDILRIGFIQFSDDECHLNFEKISLTYSDLETLKEII